MKPKKALVQSSFIILSAFYLQVSQACDQVGASESEDLLSISKSVEDRGIDTESYRFKTENCQHNQHVKNELDGGLYAAQPHTTVSSHQAHVNMLKHKKTGS